MSRYAGGLLLILVTVMFGGASLLRILMSGDMLSDWQIDQFRAGHAHAGVLMILGLVYTVLLDRARWSFDRKRLALGVLVLGGVAQSGGFFLHMVIGEAETFSAGTGLTLAGGVLLAAAVIALGVSLVWQVGEKEMIP